MDFIYRKKSHVNLAVRNAKLVSELLPHSAIHASRTITFLKLFVWLVNPLVSLAIQGTVALHVSVAST